jgi:penicillin-binding protein 2
MAAIANGGRLVRPTILAATDTPLAAEAEQLPIKPEHFQVIREGLRLAVTTGTARGLDLPTIKIAAKTGTAEVGVAKERINSLIIGFFPYERPRYAFAVVMEDGRQGQLVGALFVMRQLFDWMSLVTPEYLAYNGGN